MLEKNTHRVADEDGADRGVNGSRGCPGFDFDIDDSVLKPVVASNEHSFCPLPLSRNWLIRHTDMRHLEH